MESCRRTFLGWAVPAAILTTALRGFALQDPPPQPRRLPPPPPPRPFGQNPPQTEPPPTATPDPHTVLKSNQKDIKRDIQKLLELAQDLKKEVDKTDSAEVLNLSMLRKAEEIEKLAHQIRTMAKG
jgi:hypothetical protein